MSVTVVSTDVPLLRKLSWTLSTCGYHVVASADWSEEASWRQQSQDAILLLDARGTDRVHQLLSSPRPAAYCYRIVIQDAAADEVARLLSAGADDLLQYPVTMGELLARLRVAVRRLEFERRLAIASSRSKPLGLASRQGLIRRLEGLAHRASPESQAVLVTFGIDFFDLIQQQRGYRATRKLASTLANCVRNHLGKDDLCATVGEGVFTVLLSGTGVDDGLQFAEAVATEFGGRETLIREFRARPSISATVLSCSQDSCSPRGILDRALETLVQLKSYGGNQVVLGSEVEEELAQWQSQIEGGVLFQSVVAQHVMESFPIVVAQSQLESPPSSLLNVLAPAADQPQPPCVPVVDDAGRLVGIVSHEPCSSPFDRSTGTVALSVQPAPATADFNEPLTEILEDFTAINDDYLIVVNNERPVGCITCDGLAALFTKPITSETYRAEVGDDADLASLVVPLEASSGPNTACDSSPRDLESTLA